MTHESITPLPAGAPSDPGRPFPVPDLTTLRQGWDDRERAAAALPALPAASAGPATSPGLRSRGESIPALPPPGAPSGVPEFSLDSLDSLDSLLARVYPDQAKRSRSMQTPPGMTTLPAAPVAGPAAAEPRRTRETIPPMEVPAPGSTPASSPSADKASPLDAMPSAAAPEVALPLARDAIASPPVTFTQKTQATPRPAEAPEANAEPAPRAAEAVAPAPPAPAPPDAPDTGKPTPSAPPTGRVADGETPPAHETAPPENTRTHAAPNTGQEERPAYTDADLQDALRPIIDLSVDKFLYTPNHGIHSYLEPMLRSTVRRAIAEQMHDVSPFREAAGWDKFAWKMRALFSSRTYDDVIFDLTKRYQVEEVFLLRIHTRSLVSYASNDPARHANAGKVRGTVKKIASKCGRNGDPETGSCVKWEDNRHLMLRRGKHCILAAIVKGNSNAILRADLDYALRQAEERFGKSLEEENDIHLQVLQPLLEGCLLIKAPAIAG